MRRRSGTIIIARLFRTTCIEDLIARITADLFTCVVSYIDSNIRLWSHRWSAPIQGVTSALCRSTPIMIGQAA